MDDIWGPWIEHSGNDKPADGLFVEKEYVNGLVLMGIVGGTPKTSLELGIPYYSGETFACSWIWSGPGHSVPILRYRIRRPRGMAILNAILADLPAPVKTDGVIA